MCANLCANLCGTTKTSNLCAKEDITVGSAVALRKTRKGVEAVSQDPYYVVTSPLEHGIVEEVREDLRKKCASSESSGRRFTVKVAEEVREDLQREDLILIKPCQCGYVFDPKKQATFEVLLHEWFYESTS